MKEIDTLNSYEAMLNEPGVKCVYFYSDWCRDCHYTDRYMHLVEKRYSNINFYRVNRETVPMLSKHLNVYGVPSFLMHKGEETVARYVDKKRKTIEEVIAFIDETCKEEGCA